jgi:hypothetical protein
MWPIWWVPAQKKMKIGLGTQKIILFLDLIQMALKMHLPYHNVTPKWTNKILTADRISPI